MELTIIIPVFLIVAFVAYEKLMKFSGSREDRRRQSHFDETMSHKGRHL